MSNNIAQSVLDFWFTSKPLTPDGVSDRMGFWFGSNADADYDIERRFGKLVSLASKDSFVSWQETPKSALALIILLDQFPRNLYRANAKAFATDDKALALTKLVLERGYLEFLTPIESAFLLMPFQHAENLDDQNQGVAAYQDLAIACPEEWKNIIESICDFAKRHRAAIEKFGRFPHRNQALNRQTTEAESIYLEEGGDVF